MKMNRIYSKQFLVIITSLIILAITNGLMPGNGMSTYAQTNPLRRVNAPYFGSEEIPYSETAIFWFGRVTPSENFANVRVGYNDAELFVHVSAFDRRLWFDATPDREEIMEWDAISLLLNTNGNDSANLSQESFRFISQLKDYWVSFQGTASGWDDANIAYTALSGWRGNGRNDDIDDRGWTVAFRIPFASLGLAGPPSKGTVWGMAIELHDRDGSSSGGLQPDKSWPEFLNRDVPSTWGQLAFGMPEYSPEEASPSSTVLIRHGLIGQVVPDGYVGGRMCGEGLEFWTEWGEANYDGDSPANIQNQGDIADWPCFSRYFVTFPLDMLPKNKVILSASLTLHKTGNSGSPGEAQPSLIQILRVEENWQEQTLTWNNAPLAAENISSLWVDPVPFTDWPGTPFTWDVSYGVAQAYSVGEPLRLGFYESDGAYHSGKYFVTSDTGDWNAVGRPTLEIHLGEPVPTTTFTDVPVDYWAHDYIETLYQLGYVAGCATSPLRYCPDRILSRAESSVFILRGNYGSILNPPYPPPVLPTFTDVDPGFWGYGWIESLWTDGFTAGCSANPLAYCPLREHTRAEGSVFFLRIKNGIAYQPPAAQGIFDDVDFADWYVDWVEAAYIEGLLPACSTDPLAFCPEDPLDRAWAAYMMVQAKNIPIP